MTSLLLKKLAKKDVDSIPGQSSGSPPATLWTPHYPNGNNYLLSPYRSDLNSYVSLEITSVKKS